MLLNLSQAAEATTRRQADVAIVGAGIAGLMLATRLAAAGKRVIVLESGDAGPSAEADGLNRVVQHGDPYAGATLGRFRGLGGTSRSWGGAMLPMARADLAEHRCGWAGKWPVDYDALLAHLPEVERLFRLEEGAYAPAAAEIAKLGIDGFDLRMPKWPSFALRNVATVFAREIEDAKGPEIWLDATVTDFPLDPAGRVAGVHATSLGGKALEVAADQVVIAAGAIESTRLLLLLDARHHGRIFAGSPLGTHFHDHVSARFATLAPAHRAGANKAFGFRFGAGGMRSVRYELADAPGEGCLPSGFAHFAFGGESDGFAAIRELLQGIQARRAPSPRVLAALAANAPWVLRAAWWRYVHQRVLAPNGSDFEAHLVIEQRPEAGNRILLDPEARDRFGLRLAAIDWRVNPDDLAGFDRLSARFLAQWDKSPAASLGRLVPRTDGSAHRDLSAGGGIYHPGGSTRMAETARDGVVDGDLRCFAIPNLHVLATSSFPTGGGANPTLMLMLFALRLAGRLQQLRNG